MYTQSPRLAAMLEIADGTQRRGDWRIAAHALSPRHPPVYGLHRLPVAAVCSRLGDESDWLPQPINLNQFVVDPIPSATYQEQTSSSLVVSRGKWPLLRFISSSATATYPIKSSLSRHVCSAARPTWLRRSVRASSPAMLCTWSDPGGRRRVP